MTTFVTKWMPGVPKCDTNIKISPFIKLFLEFKFEVRFFLGANVYEIVQKFPQSPQDGSVMIFKYFENVQASILPRKNAHILAKHIKYVLSETLQKSPKSICFDILPNCRYWNIVKIPIVSLFQILLRFLRSIRFEILLKCS